MKAEQSVSDERRAQSLAATTSLLTGEETAAVGGSDVEHGLGLIYPGLLDWSSYVKWCSSLARTPAAGARGGARRAARSAKRER